MRIASTALAAALAGAVGLGLSADDARGEAPAHAQEDAQKQPVVARFEGGRLTVADVERALLNRHPYERKRIMQSDRSAFLRELVTYELLIAEAERRGYSQHTEVVQAARAAAIDAMIESELAVAPESIPEPAVAAFYDEHAERFRFPERRRATLLKLDSEAAARAARAALIGKTREQMAALAREQSTDPSRRMGGELGFFDREGRPTSAAAPAVAPELVEATFALREVGALSQPVPYAGGYALLKLTGITEANAKPLAEVAPGIREQLAGTAQQERVDALVEQLRTEHPTETHPELLGAVELEPAQARDLPAGVAAAPRDPREPPEIVEDDGV